MLARGGFCNQGPIKAASHKRCVVDFFVNALNKDVELLIV